MKVKIKNIISILLVILLLTPSTVKLFDHIFHTHHLAAEHNNKEKGFYQYHEKCLIPSFETSNFSSTKLETYTTENNSYAIINSNYSFVACCIFQNYSFLLRAPPADFYQKPYIKMM